MARAEGVSSLLRQRCPLGCSLWTPWPLPGPRAASIFCLTGSSRRLAASSPILGTKNRWGGGGGVLGTALVFLRIFCSFETFKFLNFASPLYVLDTSYLQICVLQVFSPSLQPVFSLSFKQHKFIMLMKASLSIFFLMDQIFLFCVSYVSLVNPKPQRFFSSFPRSFTV